MISRPPLPEDFDAFWTEVVQGAMRTPLYFKRDLRPQTTSTGHLVETFEFDGVDGQKLFGWFAYPEGARRAPAFLWVPPYGMESVLPNEYGTREGFASMSFNLHGLGPFHREKYSPSRGYFAKGIDTPETWVFREIVQNCIIACRVLQAQIEVDEDRIASCGMSQGGGISIWLGAFCPIVKAVCADMPFLGATWLSLVNGVYRYPLKELIDYAESVPVGLPRVLNTVGYFDTAQMATRCKAPCQVSLGHKDPAVKPEYARIIYESLSCPKRLIVYPGGHDWDPGMIANNLEWLVVALS
jgi:cephalosporin-C deacetylase